VAILRGDPNAALLTQCLRVPGTYQFKDPTRPFLCRLLLDFSNSLPAHDLVRVRTLLDAHEVYHEDPGAVDPHVLTLAPTLVPKTGWRSFLRGVPEGQRNAAGAAVVGAILCRLPEELWDRPAGAGCGSGTPGTLSPSGTGTAGDLREHRTERAGQAITRQKRFERRVGRLGTSSRDDRLDRKWIRRFPAARCQRMKSGGAFSATT